MPEGIHEAARLADQVAAEISALGGALDPAFSAAEQAATRYEEAGNNLRATLPATDEVGQAFLLGRIPSGRTLVSAFLKALSEDLCDPAAELHKRIASAADATAAGLIGWLLATLGLGLAAATLLAPIAGAILAIGLKGVCAAASVEAG